VNDNPEFLCDTCGEEFFVPEAVWNSRARIVLCPCCGGTFLIRIDDPAWTVGAA